MLGGEGLSSHGRDPGRRPDAKRKNCYRTKWEEILRSVHHIFIYIYILYILYILYIFYIYYILYILYILIYIFHIFYIFYIFYISLYHLIDMIRMMINHEIWTSRRLWLRWQTDIRKEPRDPGIGSVIWLPGMDYVLFRWCIDNICIWLYIYICGIIYVYCIYIYRRLHYIKTHIYIYT